MVEVKLPELGEGIETVEVSAVLVAVGDEVERDQPLIEVETEKASLEVPSTVAGKVEELLVEAGGNVSVGAVLARIAADDAHAAEAPPPAAAIEVPSPAAESGPGPPAPAAQTAPVIAFLSAAPAPAPRRGAGPSVPAAPSTRKLARELGIDLRQVPGTGPGSRISRADVKAFAKKLILGAAAPAVAVPPLPDFSRWGAVERQPISNVRRATARSMANAWSTVAHVTQFDRADITRAESARKQYNAKLEDAARKLSMTAIVIKQVAGALAQFPQFNASLDLEGQAVVLKKYVHIGFAADTPRGLLVPVIRDVDEKNLDQVTTQLNDLAARARNKKLSPDEMRGATFTVTNLGGLGTTYFSPIVNWPEVAILGVGRATMEPVYADGEFQPRLVMPLSLSYDHRLIDGADAARFLRHLAESLEQPLPLPAGD